MQELVHQNHFVVYPNTFMVFEYLCNRANIRANRVFVSALILEQCDQSSNENRSKSERVYRV